MERKNNEYGKIWAAIAVIAALVAVLAAVLIVIKKKSDKYKLPERVHSKKFIDFSNDDWSDDDDFDCADFFDDEEIEAEIAAEAAVDTEI